MTANAISLGEMPISSVSGQATFSMDKKVAHSGQRIWPSSMNIITRVSAIWTLPPGPMSEMGSKAEILGDCATRLGAAFPIPSPRILPFRRRRFLQHQMALPLDERPHFFGQHAEQPRQLHFDAHVILGNVDRAGGGLAQDSGAEIEMVAGPVLLDHRQLLSESRAGAAETGLQAADRLFLAELVRNGNHERTGHAVIQTTDDKGQMTDNE